MRQHLLLPAIALLLLLVGCGNDDDAGSGGTDTTSSQAAPAEPEASGPSPEAEPLPLTAHVVPADGLPGFAGQGAARLQDLATFAEEHDKTPGELRRSGMVAGSSLVFQPAGDAEGFGMSIAAEFGSPDEANAEADRLFAANSEVEPGSTVTPLEVPGIPGARAIEMVGKDGGMSFRGVEIIFVDGVVLHEVFAVAEQGSLDVAAVVQSATDLYSQVAGRPLAAG